MKNKILLVILMFLFVGSIIFASSYQMNENQEEEQKKIENYINLYVSSRSDQITWFTPQDAYLFSRSRNPFINGYFYN